MVLSRLTKITGPGVATDTNWVGNNADFTGITTTATSFNIGVTTIHSNLIEAHNIVSTGVITATGGSFSGNVTAVDGTFTGNVSIAGTLTYEDVTNIDSVGIITAPALDVDDFLDVGSNIKLGNAGVITATSFVGSGAALTGIDATAIKDSGGNVKVQAQASGAMYTGIHTFTTLNSSTGTFSGAIDANGDLDVDGHTNLDNLSVAGVATFAGNLNVGGVLTYEDVKNVDSVGLGTFRDGLIVNTGTATTALVVQGDARVTGILTIGTGSLKITDRDIHAVGVVTGSNFKTGSTNVHSSGVEAAGINVTGADTPIGAGATIFNSGDVVSKAGAEFQGIVTATSFSGSGANLTGLASREVYGFTGIGNSLSLTTTNNGADNITNATYVAFEESFIGPSGISFSINTSGNLIMTV